jgi:hypothetical protein
MSRDASSRTEFRFDVREAALQIVLALAWRAYRQTLPEGLFKDIAGRLDREVLAFWTEHSWQDGASDMLKYDPAEVPRTSLRAIAAALADEFEANWQVKHGWSVGGLTFKRSAVPPREAVASRWGEVLPAVLPGPAAKAVVRTFPSASLSSTALRPDLKEVKVDSLRGARAWVRMGEAIAHWSRLSGRLDQIDRGDRALAAFAALRPSCAEAGAALREAALERAWESYPTDAQLPDAAVAKLAELTRTITDLPVGQSLDDLQRRRRLKAAIDQALDAMPQSWPPLAVQEVFRDPLEVGDLLDPDEAELETILDLFPSDPERQTRLLYLVYLAQAIDAARAARPDDPKIGYAVRSAREALERIAERVVAAADPASGEVIVEVIDPEHPDALRKYKDQIEVMPRGDRRPQSTGLLLLTDNNKMSIIREARVRHHDSLAVRALHKIAENLPLWRSVRDPRLGEKCLELADLLGGFVDVTAWWETVRDEDPPKDAALIHQVLRRARALASELPKEPWATDAVNDLLSEFRRAEIGLVAQSDALVFDDPALKYKVRPHAYLLSSQVTRIEPLEGVVDSDPTVGIVFPGVKGGKPRFFPSETIALVPAAWEKDSPLARFLIKTAENRRRLFKWDKEWPSLENHLLDYDFQSRGRDTVPPKNIDGELGWRTFVALHRRFEAAERAHDTKPEQDRKRLRQIAELYKIVAIELYQELDANDRLIAFDNKLNRLPLDCPPRPDDPIEWVANDTKDKNAVAKFSFLDADGRTFRCEVSLGTKSPPESVTAWLGLPRPNLPPDNPLDRWWTQLPAAIYSSDGTFKLLEQEEAKCRVEWQKWLREEANGARLAQFVRATGQSAPNGDAERRWLGALEKRGWLKGLVPDVTVGDQGVVVRWPTRVAPVENDVVKWVPSDTPLRELVDFDGLVFALETEKAAGLFSLDKGPHAALDAARAAAEAVSRIAASQNDADREFCATRLKARELGRVVDQATAAPAMEDAEQVVRVLDGLLTPGNATPARDRDALLNSLREWLYAYGYELLPSDFSFLRPLDAAGANAPWAFTESDEEKGQVLVRSFGFAAGNLHRREPELVTSSGCEPKGLVRFRLDLSLCAVDASPILSLLDDWPQYAADPNSSRSHAVQIFRRFWEINGPLPASGPTEKNRLEPARAALDDMLKEGLRIDVFYPDKNNHFGVTWFDVIEQKKFGREVARIRRPGLLLITEPNKPFNKAEVDLN